MASLVVDRDAAAASIAEGEAHGGFAARPLKTQDKLESRPPCSYKYPLTPSGSMCLPLGLLAVHRLSL